MLLIRNQLSRFFGVTITLLLCTCCGAASKNNDVDSANTLKEPPRLVPMSETEHNLGSSSTPQGSSAKNNADSSHDTSCDLNAPLPDGIEANLSAQELHALAQDRIIKRDTTAALPILKHAIEKSPKDAKILGDMGTALLQCGLNEEAIKYVEKAVALEPNNISLAANLAQTYQIAGRISDAVAAYRAAIKTAPNDPSLRNNLAVLLIIVKDLPGAEAAVRKALEFNPTSVNYMVNLGYILARQKRYRDAEIILKRAIKLDPKSADAFNQLGLVYAAEGRQLDASINFKKALDIKPTHTGARENINAVEEGFDFEGPWGKSKK